MRTLKIQIRDFRCINGEIIKVPNIFILDSFSSNQKLLSFKEFNDMYDNILDEISDVYIDYRSFIYKETHILNRIFPYMNKDIKLYKYYIIIVFDASDNLHSINASVLTINPYSFKLITNNYSFEALALSGADFDGDTVNIYDFINISYIFNGYNNEDMMKECLDYMNKNLNGHHKSEIIDFYYTMPFHEGNRPSINQPDWNLEEE